MATAIQTHQRPAQERLHPRPTCSTFPGRRRLLPVQFDSERHFLAKCQGIYRKYYLCPESPYFSLITRFLVNFTAGRSNTPNHVEALLKKYLLRHMKPYDRAAVATANYNAGPTQLLPVLSTAEGRWLAACQAVYRVQADMPVQDLIEGLSRMCFEPKFANLNELTCLIENFRERYECASGFSIAFCRAHPEVLAYLLRRHSRR